MTDSIGVMMLRQIGLALLITLASSCLFAAELQQIILQDGSQVNAEVLSLKNGVYTLKSPALGQITVNARKIRTIQTIRGTAPHAKTSEPTDAPVNIEQIQSSLLANRGTVNIIMSLRDDPTVKAILGDRDIMAAIQQGDYTSLANNPKIKKLMSKAEIKQITGSIAP
jgi:hypothetical protein